MAFDSPRVCTCRGMFEHLNSGHRSQAMGWSGPGVQVPRDSSRHICASKLAPRKHCSLLVRPSRTGIFVAWEPFMATPVADGKKAFDPGVKSLQSRPTRPKVARPIDGATNVGGGSASRLQGDSMLRNSITLYCALLPAILCELLTVSCASLDTSVARTT